MKYTVGKKMKAPAQPANDADHLYGPGWAAERTDDGYVLEWDGGEIMTKVVKAQISEAEFERLREDPDSFPQIRLEHDPYR